MKKIFLIILIHLSLIARPQSDCRDIATVESQESTAKCESLLSKRYLKSYWNSGLTVLAQPLHYDWKDWTAFAGVAAVSTLTFIYDDEIYKFVDGIFDDNQSKIISRSTCVFGEELFVIPTVALTYAISAINKDCRLRNLSLAALQSFIYAEVATAGIKVLSCRKRPLEVDGFNSRTWLGPFATFESTSFVSGHAMRAFALATTVAGFYHDKKWVGVVSYSLATITSLGRVAGKKHWASDVVVGAALGYFIGKGVVKFNEKIGNIDNVEIEPIVTDCGVGVALRF